MAQQGSYKETGYNQCDFQWLDVALIVPRFFDNDPKIKLSFSKRDNLIQYKFQKNHLEF